MFSSDSWRASIRRRRRELIRQKKMRMSHLQAAAEETRWRNNHSYYLSLLPLISWTICQWLGWHAQLNGTQNSSFSLLVPVYMQRRKSSHWQERVLLPNTRRWHESFRRLIASLKAMRRTCWACVVQSVASYVFSQIGYLWCHKGPLTAPCRTRVSVKDSKIFFSATGCKQKANCSASCHCREDIISHNI